MEQEGFRAGVEPGGLTKAYEIKMLLCYLLNSVGEPMTFSQINEACRKDGLVNYFELAEALGELVGNAHLEREQSAQGDIYSLTGRGREAAASFAKSIPLSVREKAEKAAKIALTRDRRLREVRIAEEKVEDGYRLTLSIPDLSTELMSVSLFVPTKKESAQIKRQFINDPEFIYKSILSLLTGNSQVAGDLSPSGQDLFE